VDSFVIEQLIDYPFLLKTSKGYSLDLHLVPRSKKSRVAGVHGNKLKIAVGAPPVDGKANKELIAFLARLLGCPKSSIEIERGAASREKIVIIKDITEEKILTALDEALKSA
jgi:uncharacterized protein